MSVGFAYNHTHRTVVESTIQRGPIAPTRLTPSQWWVTCTDANDVTVMAHDGTQIAAVRLDSGVLGRAMGFDKEHAVAIAQGILAIRGEAGAAMPAVAPPPAQPGRASKAWTAIGAFVLLAAIGGVVFYTTRHKLHHHQQNLSVGSACTYDVECSTNNCKDDKCVSNEGDRIEGSSCMLDRQCKSGVCRNDVCFERRAARSVCKVDEDCMSDNCQNGICNSPR